MCPVPLGTKKHTDTSWPFRVLEDQHVEKVQYFETTLGLLAYSVRPLGLHTNFTIHETAISIVHVQPH